MQRRLTALSIEESSHTARELALPSGRRVLVTPGDLEQLVVHGPSGEVELRIRFTDEGPILSFESAAIDLKARGALTLEGERVAVRGRSGVTVECGGDLETHVAGDERSLVDGRSSHEARSVAIEAKRGDVAVTANDDVVVVGERIRLN